MKIVVVTGTSRGLGESIAMHLLKEGFIVLGISRSLAGEKLSSEENFHQVQFDLQDTERIPELCSSLVSQFGTPFGLVNNSALGLDGLLATQNNTDIHRQIAVNLTAPILMTKYLSRNMLDKREGRIINISSIVASTGYKGLAVYAATKAGLLGLGKSLSRELGARNITVNSVQPGFMETEMTSALEGESLAKVKRRSALGRLAKTEDVAEVIGFLLGDGGRNITGQSIVVDAGNSA